MREQRFLEEQRNAGNRTLTLEDCIRLRRDWLNAFPEMQRYFKEVETFPLDPSDDQSKPYMARTLTGMVRRYCDFNAAANHPFQGLAAAGAKAALWDLLVAGYRLTCFIHDEVIIELPRTRQAFLEDIPRIKSIMESSMARFTPDVKITAVGSATEKWNKNEEGELTIEDV